MSLSIGVGDNTVELTPDGDLAKYLTPGLDTVFHVDQRMQELMAASNGTLANSIEGSLTAGFNTSQQVKWDLSEYANIALVFRPAFSGTIQITNPVRFSAISKVTAKSRLRPRYPTARCMYPSCSR